MNKNKVWSFIGIVLIFIITVLYSMFGYRLSEDDVWCYGFVYNLASGLVPYVDYNMVIGPVFPILGSLFLLMLGKNMMSFIIFGAVVATGIFILSKKVFDRSYLIFYALFLLYSTPNYSVLCIFFLLLLMYLEGKKCNDYLIGIILGLTILTKIHVGLFLCIPSLFLGNSKKIIHRVIGAGSVGAIALLIMCLVGNIDGFVNYTMLGLFDFAKNNGKVYEWFYLVLTSIIYGLYLLIVKKEKDIKLKYVLCFLILGYPIFSTYHSFLASVPSFGYYLNKIKLHRGVLIGSFCIWIAFLGFNYTLRYYKENMTFDSNSVLFKYKIEPKDMIKTIEETFDYIEDNSKDKDVYIFSKMVYMYKLEKGKKINKFDLINNGNIGYRGEEVYIADISNNCHNNCIFFIADKEKSQANKDIKNFVKNKYKYVKSYEMFDIYEG